MRGYETLPSWTYSSDAFFELEKKNLFLNNWQLICHSSNIPNSGDYFTFDIFNERLLAIRNEKYNINVFHNVCSHRATKLLDQVQTGKNQGEGGELFKLSDEVENMRKMQRERDASLRASHLKKLN